MSDHTTRTWIITGASSGLGLALAIAALEAGENVVGTARRRQRFAPLQQKYGDRLSTVEHDVGDAERASGVIEQAVRVFGRVDVLVNNAGAGQVGGAEEITDAQLRSMLDQHLFGPAALVRAVLPYMRDQAAGAIVQMSSQGGRMSFPGVASYSAGKFALEGWSEALAGEVARFGIRVLIVEPSRFRTEFNSVGVLQQAGQRSEYDGVLKPVRADMVAAAGSQEGDPARAAQIIREQLSSADMPLRLPLGAEAARNLCRAYKSGLEGVRRLASIAESADFPGVPTSNRGLLPAE